jgi:hypothetical protein
MPQKLEIKFIGVYSVIEEDGQIPILSEAVGGEDYEVGFVFQGPAGYGILIEDKIYVALKLDDKTFMLDRRPQIDTSVLLLDKLLAAAAEWSTTGKTSII